MHEKFSSEFMEREYLKVAPAAEVLRYLDTVSYHLPDETVDVLFDRNERAIDLGLAKSASQDERVERILERYSSAVTQIITEDKTTSDGGLDTDHDILTAVLSNQNAMSFNWDVPKWLEKKIKAIGVTGSDSQLEALFSNPELPAEICLQVLNRSDWWQVVPESRYRRLLDTLLANILVNPNLIRELDMSGPPGAYGMNIAGACWGLLLHLEPTEKGCYALTNAMPNFPEIQVPYEFKKSLNLSSDLYFSEARELSTEAYLKTVLQRWQKPAAEKRDWPWSFIRRYIVKKIPDYHLFKFESLILGSNDPHQIEGFFGTVGRSDLFGIVEKLDEYYAAYGRDFLSGFIDNDNIYLRGRNAFGKKFYELVKNFEIEDSTREYTLEDYEKRGLRERLWDQIEYLNSQPGHEKFISDSDDWFNEAKKTDEENLSDLNQNFEAFKNKLKNINDENTSVSELWTNVDKRLDSVGELWANVDERLDSLNKRFSVISTSMDVLSENVDLIVSKVNQGSVPWAYILLGAFIGYVFGTW